MSKNTIALIQKKLVGESYFVILLKIICQMLRLAILSPCWICAAPDNSYLWV